MQTIDINATIGMSFINQICATFICARSLENNKVDYARVFSHKLAILGIIYHESRAKNLCCKMHML